MPEPTKNDLRRWHDVSGGELEEAVSRGEELSGLILECQAIYVWRRLLEPPAHVVASADLLVEWIQRSLTVPIAEIREKQLTHFSDLGCLTVRSAPLSAEKLQQLKKLAMRENWRRWLVRFLSSASMFTPPLYVGETNSMPSRAREHLIGESGFGARVVAPASTISWADLQLVYYPLVSGTSEDNPEVKSKRTLFETLITGFSLAGYVDRRG